jgi:hypothetical protein
MKNKNNYLIVILAAIGIILLWARKDMDKEEVRINAPRISHSAPPAEANDPNLHFSTIKKDP